MSHRTIQMHILVIRSEINTITNLTFLTLKLDSIPNLKTHLQIKSLVQCGLSSHFRLLAEQGGWDTATLQLAVTVRSYC